MSRTTSSQKAAPGADHGTPVETNRAKSRRGECDAAQHRQVPVESAERDLDALLASFNGRGDEEPSAKAAPVNPIDCFRDLLLRELIPAFEELVEKYGQTGVSLQMDASSLLDGGRELKLEFEVGAHRSRLEGTLTSDAIAFQEVRYSPDFQGQLLAGPMLRLKSLTREKFREFVCERLALLLKQVAKRRP